MSDLAVFGYGSLVSRDSVRATLGPGVGEPIPARLPGWRRRWSLVRDNHRSEKGFAPPPDSGMEPFDWCHGLNVERAPDAPEALWPNGALIALGAEALERLRVRELRYDPVVVEIPGTPFDRIITFTAKPANFRPEPLPRSVILSTYMNAVEAAFVALGPEELDAFRETTGPPPVPVIDAVLVRDEIPPGNPRAW